MTDTTAITEHWTQVADQWIDWAGKPGHDAFWKYRAPRPISAATPAAR